MKVPAEKHRDGCAAGGRIFSCPNDATRVVDDRGRPLFICGAHDV